MAGGDIRVSYHWKSRDGNTIVADGARTLLPSDVAPGDAVTVCATVTAPETPGAVRLEWDMVQEGVSWFSSAGPENLSAIDAEIVAPVGQSAWSYAAPIAFVALTIGHFVLMWFWLVALCPALARRDCSVFYWFVTALGTLQAVLHSLAFTVGLTMGRGLIGICLFHGALATTVAVVLRRRPTTPTNPSSAPASPEPHEGLGARLPALVGMALMAALAIQWALVSPRSLSVIGTDAAHYHVPYAVNIALGANPFGLPATAHLYPMGTSVLAAWFILPFPDGLLVDLTTLLPFVMAWLAISVTVGLIVGRSALGWGPWCALLIFAMPLSRSSLPMSADLYYCASFLAVNAVLLDVYSTLSITRLQATALALATGMLLSAKVTGGFSVVMLGVVYGGALALRAWRLRRRVDWPRPLGLCLGACAVAVIAAGGIWIVRNWWDYGSPLAPSGLALFGHEIFRGEKYSEGKYYLSVLKDLRDIPGYDLPARLVYWSRRWLGGWFLPACLVIPIAPFVRAWLRGRWRTETDDASATRLTFVVASLIVVAIHAYLIAGTSWSSLEWTDGFALRLLLPCVALGVMAIYASVVSLWNDKGLVPTILCYVVAAAAVSWYVTHDVIRGVALDETPARLTLVAIALGVLTVTVAMALARLPLAWRTVAATVCVAGIAVLFGVRLTDADASLLNRAETEFEGRCSCAGAGQAGDSDYRTTYLQLVAFERSHAIACDRRRFFVTTRWDFPLELQSPRFDNQVFAIQGPSSDPRLLEWDRPGSQPCDYVIASRAALDTQRGVPLVNALKARGRLHTMTDGPKYVVFSAR